MTVIMLDTDIAAASTTLALDKINAQHYRSALGNLAAHQAALITNEQAAIDLARQTRTLTLREQITVAIADKYMTTSTSLVPETVLADAQADAARLKAAVDEVMKTLTP